MLVKLFSTKPLEGDGSFQFNLIIIYIYVVKFIVFTTETPPDNVDIIMLIHYVN